MDSNVDDNSDDYAIPVQASLINKVESMKDGSFLVIHGTADDNVHIQHTMMLSKTLVQNHVIFRQQVDGLDSAYYRSIKRIVNDWIGIHT